MKFNFRVLSIVVLGLFIITACNSNNDVDLFNQAKDLIAQKKYNEALLNFEKIVNEYPQSNLKMMATLEIGKLYHGKAIKGIEEKESVNNGIKYYLDVFNNYPDSTESAKALFYAGFLLANDVNNYDSAKVLYEKFLNVYPEHELCQHVRLEIENLGLTADEILSRKLDGKTKN